MMNHHNITSESLINEEETSITTLHNSQSHKAHFNLQVASKNQMLQTNAMIHGQYIRLTKLMRWKVKNTNKYYPLAESQVGQNVTVLNWKFNFVFGGYLALWFDWMRAWCGLTVAVSAAAQIRNSFFQTLILSIMETRNDWVLTHRIYCVQVVIGAL